MRIAGEQLGDERRYTEIDDLNHSRRQPDGNTLRDVARIKPGWQLELPLRKTVKGYRVQLGETLRSIANGPLGRADRYQEIVRLNQSVHNSAASERETRFDFRPHRPLSPHPGHRNPCPRRQRRLDTFPDAGTIEVPNQIVQYGWEAGQTKPKPRPRRASLLWIRKLYRCCGPVWRSRTRTAPGSAVTGRTRLDLHQSRWQPAAPRRRVR